MSRRVSFSPDDHPTYYDAKGGGNKKRYILPIKCSAAKFFWHIGAKVSRALRFASGRKRCSRKVSSSSSSSSSAAANLARSHSYVLQNLDSQRAEAIEDCIEFLNSSSSLSRSNSIRSSNC